MIIEDNGKYIVEVEGVRYIGPESGGFFPALADAEAFEATVIAKVAEDKLNEAKRLKKNEIDSSLEAALSQPVTVGSYVFAGGTESARNLDGQWRLIKDYAAISDPSITSVTFFDVNYDPVTVPLASDTDIDAADIVAAVSNQVSTLMFKAASLKKAVDAASAIAEVNAISW